MKTIIPILLLSGTVGLFAQTESNLNVRVDVPAAVVEQARIYMWMIGETNMTTRQWLSSNVIVTLPPAVTEAVDTRKRDMIQQVQNATLQLLKKFWADLGY